MASKLTIKFGKIRAQPIEENGLNLLALIEQHRRGKLHGSVHREIGIGDDFETRTGFGHDFFRSARSHPGKLHLRERRDLGHSAERECKRVGVSRKTAARRAIVRVVEENFVHDQRQTVVAAKGVQRRSL